MATVGSIRFVAETVTERIASRALEIVRLASARIGTGGASLAEIHDTVHQEARWAHRTAERGRVTDKLREMRHPHEARARDEEIDARIWAVRDADLLMAMIGPNEADAMDRLRRLAG